MESTLVALGGLMLKALPTLLLLLLLHFYMKLVFFRPLERALRKRREATDGVRQTAEQSLAEADRKAAGYEDTLRRVRAEMFRRQEEHRNEWREERGAALEQVRRQADALVKDGRQLLAREAEEARSRLTGEAEALAEQIAAALLRRRTQ